MTETLYFIEHVLPETKSYAVYGQCDAEGYTRSLALDAEPRDTVLERAREKFATTYPKELA